MSLFFGFFSVAGMAIFTVFLRGGWGRWRVLWWCFDGEFVVVAWLKVERRHHVVESLKTRHSF
jgi:hypothetical protein